MQKMSQNRKDKISTGAKGTNKNVGVVLVLSDPLNLCCQLHMPII